MPSIKTIVLGLAGVVPLSLAYTGYQGIPQAKRNLQARDTFCETDADCNDGMVCDWVLDIDSTGAAIKACSSGMFSRDLEARQDSAMDFAECSPSQDDCPEGQTCGLALTTTQDFTYACQEGNENILGQSKLKSRQDESTMGNPCSTNFDCLGMGETCDLIDLVTEEKACVMHPWKRDRQARQDTEATLSECEVGLDNCPEGQICALASTDTQGFTWTCQESQGSPSLTSLDTRQVAAPSFPECDFELDDCPEGQICTLGLGSGGNDVTWTCQDENQSSPSTSNLDTRQTTYCDSSDECPEGQVCAGHSALIDENFWCEDELLYKRNLVKRHFQECETHADCAAGQSCLPGSGRPDIPGPAYCMTDEAKRDLFNPSRA